MKYLQQIKSQKHEFIAAGIYTSIAAALVIGFQIYLSL